jgi:hypothetical protein
LLPSISAAEEIGDFRANQERLREIVNTKHVSSN